MNESSSSVSLPAVFLADVERLLTPAYAECFTDETRKVRNLLLVTSLVLILFVFGVVAVGNAVNLSLLPLSITVRTGMRWMLIALCAYFLLLLAARSYIEWKLWRLRQQAPIRGLRDLSTKATYYFVEVTNSANAMLASSLDAFRGGTDRLKEMILEPLAVAPIQKRRDELRQQSQLLLAEMQRMLALPETREQEHWNEYIKLRNHQAEIDEEIDELDDQLSQERDARHKQFMDESEAQQRQFDKAREVHGRLTTASEMKVAEAELTYIDDKVRSLSGILTIRRWFEMLFPILFGLLALLLGFVVRGTS
jgi:hypothetical protein